MPEPPRKDDRIFARCNSNLKRRIQHAAQLKGLDLTTYVLSTLEADAEKTLRDHEIFELSQRDRLAFAKTLLNPPKANANLIAAAKRYKKRKGH